MHKGFAFQDGGTMLEAINELVSTRHRFEAVFDAGLGWWILRTSNNLEAIDIVSYVAFRLDPMHGTWPPNDVLTCPHSSARIAPWFESPPPWEYGNEPEWDSMTEAQQAWSECNGSPTWICDHCGAEIFAL